MFHPQVHLQSTRRTDQELIDLTSDAGNWVVNGSYGQILCLAGSLGKALERAGDYARSDAVVVALTRLPPDGRIVVQADQINRLRPVRRETARAAGIAPKMALMPNAHAAKPTDQVVA